MQFRANRAKFESRAKSPIWSGSLCSLRPACWPNSTWSPKSSRSGPWTS